MKQSLTLGLGLVDLTKEKLDKIVKELNKGISKHDKEKAVDELFKHARSAKNEAEKVLKAHVKKLLDNLKIAKKK